MEWAGPFRERILKEAYNERLGFFTQSLHGQNGDASNLLLPTLGFIEAKDPRFVSTVKAYERSLVKNNLMLRYNHPDDFGETTNAFSICSFWWVEALAMIGELDRAAEIFEQLLKHANPLGLFSEDIDPETGRLLGNFPQAYTHVGMIHAAITIGELRDALATKFKLPSAKRWVSMGARLQRFKGHIHFLRALAALPADTDAASQPFAR